MYLAALSSYVSSGKPLDEENKMKANRHQYRKRAAAAVAALFFGMPAQVHSQQRTSAAITIGNNDLGGVVTSADGPEAGVWVIAETTDLPTKFARSVVTDEQGRYLIPDLPEAKYRIWVRGYGLVDSAKIDSAPGRMLDLTAQIAPDEG